MKNFLSGLGFIVFETIGEILDKLKGIGFFFGLLNSLLNSSFLYKLIDFKYLIITIAY